MTIANVTDGGEIPDFKHSSREDWLNAAAEYFRPWFESRGATYPVPLRVSCGLAGGRIGGRAIGECWSDEASTDKAREIFISPVLDQPVRVLDVLLHEIVHAVLPHSEGHGSNFKKLATDLGLTGKMTATIAGPELEACLNDVATALGPYPHAALNVLKRPKQTTRMLKVECPDCKYTVRTSQKWIEVGVPTCPCGTVMAVPEPEEGTEDE